MYGFRNGLGFDYYDLLASAGGTQQCDARDSFCVAQNEQLTDAVRALWASKYAADPNTAILPAPKVNVQLDTSPAALAQFMNNQVVTDQRIQVQGGPSYTDSALLASGPLAAGPVQAVQARGGQLSFTNSRGGTSLKVGDTWLITITGATPNTQVSVSGSGPAGSYSGTQMGTTDASGNFSKSGSFGTGDVGSWSESWSVGSVPSGSFSFSVSTPAASPVQFATGGGSSAPSSSSDGFTLPTIGFDLSSVPWWGWAGAAGVALLAFGGRG